MTKKLDTPFTNSYKTDTLKKKNNQKLGVKYMKKKKSIRLSTNHCVNFLWITFNRSRK